MRTVAVRIEGEKFSDAFAYRGHLYCWTLANELIAYPVDALVDALHEAHGQTGLAAAYALFSSRGIGATEAMKEAFRLNEVGPDRTLVITPAPVFRMRNEAKFGHVLDMSITYDRLHLATETGFYTHPLETGRLIGRSTVSPQLQHPGHCFSISNGYGAVGASFGTEGLYFVTNDIGPASSRRKVQLAEVTSVRSAITYTHVTNFSSDEDFQFIPAVASVDERTKTRWVESISTETLRREDDRWAPPDSPRRYLYWDSRFRRLLNISESGIGTLGRNPRTSTAAEWQGRMLSDSPRGVIVSAFSTRNQHFIVESTDALSVVKDGEWRTYETGPCLSARSYKNSWRFRRLVTATSRSGLWLIAAFSSGPDED